MSEITNIYRTAEVLSTFPSTASLSQLLHNSCSIIIIFSHTEKVSRNFKSQ